MVKKLQDTETNKSQSAVMLSRVINDGHDYYKQQYENKRKFMSDA